MDTKGQPNIGNDDSAILILDTPAPVTSAPSMDGHRILNHVQLQFIPTDNDNAYVPAGAMGHRSAMPAYESPSTAAVILTGTMEEENRRNRDSDLLVIDDDDSNEIGLRMPDGSGPGNQPKPTIWQFENYVQYFDLTTEVFFRRIIWSLLPLSSGDKGTYISRHIQSVPDLYGPFWIPLTLAFVISVCDDILRYLKNISDHAIPVVSAVNATTKAPETQTCPPLAFTFERMNAATTLTFSYVIFAPLILWSFCQWRRCTKLYTFTECLCAYGYSLSLFIPVTILALINVMQIQFILFASAAFLSGSVLLISFAPVVHSDPSRSFKFAYVMLLFILVAHVALALLYLFYFYNIL